MNKFVKLAAVAGLSLGLLAGCGSSSDVSTGGKNDVQASASKDTSKQAAPKKEDGTKKFTANASGEAVGLKVNIADISITADKIEVGMNIQNTNKDKITFFPDQDGKIVVGDMQLDANLVKTKGNLSGDIEGGVKKDGVIVFDAPEGKKLDVAKITSLKLKFGEVNSPDYSESKDLSFDIPVK